MKRDFSDEKDEENEKKSFSTLKNNENSLNFSTSQNFSKNSINKKVLNYSKSEFNLFENKFSILNKEKKNNSIQKPILSINNYIKKSTIPLMTNITKEQINRFQIINQIDKKFILFKVDKF